MIAKTMKLFLLFLSTALASFNPPVIKDCSFSLSWKDMKGPIELRNSKGKFFELKECTGKEACSIPLSRFSESPFNLVRD